MILFHFYALLSLVNACCLVHFVVIWLLSISVCLLCWISVLLSRTLCAFGLAEYTLDYQLSSGYNQTPSLLLSSYRPVYWWTSFWLICAPTFVTCYWYVIDIIWLYLSYLLSFILDLLIYLIDWFDLWFALLLVSLSDYWFYFLLWFIFTLLFAGFIYYVISLAPLVPVHRYDRLLDFILLLLFAFWFLFAISLVPIAIIVTG